MKDHKREHRATTLGCKLFRGILGLAFILALGACSASGGPANGKNPIGQNLRYDPAAPVNKGASIAITFWTQVDQETVYRKLVQDYMAIHPNVRIELVASDYNDYFNNLDIALQSDIGPDVFHIHNSFDGKLRPYLQAYPEDQLPLAALQKDFRQVGAHVTNGKVYYIDTGLMTSAIYYNKEYWAKAGLGDKDVPRTWQQLRTIAQRLTVRGGDGQVLRAGFNPNGIAFSIFTAINLQRGQLLFTDQAKTVPILSTVKSRESMEFIRGLYRLAPVSSDRMPEFHESFGTGDAAMIYAWGWTDAWLKRNFPKLDYGAFPTPTWEGGDSGIYDRNNGESSPGVNRHASPDHQAVAFDLIRFFLASDSYLTDLCARFNVLPSKRNLDGAPEFSQGAQAALTSTILDRTIWPGILPSYYETVLTDTLIDPVILQNKPIAQALRDAETGLREAYRQHPVH